MNGHHVFSECAILVVYSFKGISGVLEINKKYALRYLSLLQYVWTCPAIHEITLCSRRHPCCLSRIWPLGVTAAAALATAATASNINETDLSVPCSRRVVRECYLIRGGSGVSKSQLRHAFSVVPACQIKWTS